MEPNDQMTLMREFGCCKTRLLSLLSFKRGEIDNYNIWCLSVTFKLIGIDVTLFYSFGNQSFLFSLFKAPNIIKMS